MRLVCMVEGYVVEEVHRHMVEVVDNHTEVHHSHRIGMHLGMVLAHSALERVITMKIDHKHMAPPTFDSSILDASLHCSSHFL
ncbi:hypothetical protein AHAS_Ahas17G0198800 [Arachis hypogaea]